MFHRKRLKMIEDYGTLSEDELLEEILRELEEETEIDPNNLEFLFQKDKLVVRGTLQNQEELEYLVGVLENHLEAGDYDLEIELSEGQEEELIKEEPFSDTKVVDSEDEEYVEEHLEKIDEDEVDFADDEEVDDEEKW
jgi:hypothetical protein